MRAANGAVRGFGSTEGPERSRIEDAVARWPTPAASVINDGESPTSFFERRDRLKRTANNGNGAGVPLTIAAVSWPTASARDWKGVDRQQVDRGNARPLNEVASTWPTPTSLSFGDSHQPGNSRSYNKTMELAAGINWMTPRVATGDYTRDRGAKGGERLTLEGQSKWSTPSVADVMGGRKARSGTRNGEALMNGQADALSSDLLAPATSRPGDMSPSSLLSCYRRYRATTDFALRWERRALLLLAIRRRGRGWTRKPAPVFTRPSFRRQLNARFVEWLMSWPPGLTSFECSETALLTHKALWRSELALMTSLPAAPPAQLSLFG